MSDDWHIHHTTTQSTKSTNDKSTNEVKQRSPWTKSTDAVNQRSQPKKSTDEVTTQSAVDGSQCLKLTMEVEA